MQLSLKARKAMAAGLAASTLLWSASSFLPKIASAAPHSDGCLVLSGGVVWLITGGTRRGFTSAEVFASHGHNFSQVVTANAEDAAMPVGPIMTYADGTLVKGPNDPLVYLVANGQKRPFVSGSVFTGLGYSFSNIQQAPVNTFQDLPTGANLDSSAVAHPAGTVVISNGAIWKMTATGRMGFPSAAVFSSHGYMFSKVVAANSYDLAMPDEGAVAMKAACTGGGGTTPPPVSGSVNVTAAGPSSTTLIVDTTDGGANTSQSLAHLGSFMFTGSGTVTSVTIARTGVSADAMLTNVYLFDGATRLTDAGAFSSGSLTFANGSGLFTVSGSKTLSVKADLDDGSYAGQTVGVNLTAASVTGGTVGGLPAMGPTHTVAGASLATVAVAAPTASGATDPGNDITVWQSTWTVGVRDVNFTRLALRQINNIQSSDIRNFRLLVDGVQVASQANLDSNGYVTFSGFTKLLKTGTPVIRVMADVIGGSSRSVQMSLRNKADVDVMDSQYNVNVSATGTFPATPAAFAVNAGTVTVIKATDSPSGNVTNNASSIKLGKWTVTAYGEPVKIENLAVSVDTNNTDADYTLRNGKLFVNGSQVGATTGLVAAGAATAAATFTTNFTVNPGTPATVELYSDIFDEEDGGAELIAGSTIQTSLVDNDVSNATPQVSLTPFDVPTTNDIAANQLTVSEGSMALAALASYPNQTTVAPQTGYKLGAWTLTGSSTEDINLSSLSLDIDAVGGATFTSADLSNIYIRYGSSTTSIKPTPTATNNDWSISHVLPRNSVLTIELFGDIGTGANITDGNSVKTDLSVAGTTAQSGVAVAQNDIDGQTIAENAGTFTTARDASSPDSTLVDDSGTVAVARFRADATYENYTIREVDVNLSNATAVSNIILKDGSTTLGTLPGATSVLFAGLNVLVNANTTKVLTVELQMSTVGVGAGTSGSNVTATLDSVKYSANSTGVEATRVETLTCGTDTDCNAADDGTDAAGNNTYAYKALPTISLVTLPSASLGNGTQTLAKFSVNTNGTGTVAWKAVRLTVSKTGGAADAAGTDPLLASATLWNADSGTQITAATSFVSSDGDAGGSDTATNCEELDTACTIVVVVGTDADDNVEEQVSGARTYEVRATVNGTLATGDYISSSIARPSAFAASVVYTAVDADNAGGGTTDESFAWSDVSAASHDTGTADWTNDNLLKQLPTGTQTLTR